MSARRTKISRRQFGATLGAVPVLAAARPAVARQDDVSTLYDRAIVIDALANPGSMNVSWPPRGPLSQKQRDAIASSGITAINVTVSADFEGSVRNIALWQGEVDRYPDVAVGDSTPCGYREGKTRQDARLDARLPEHRHDRARHLARRPVPSARHSHHSAHLQRSQPGRRRVSRDRATRG